MKKIFISCLLALLLVVIGYMTYSRLAFATPQVTIPLVKVTVTFDPLTPQSEPYSQDPSIDDPASLWVIVNKDRAIPLAYQPELVVPHVRQQQSAQTESMQVSVYAAPDLERMFAAMETAGLQPILVSGYRSAITQKQIYEGYVAAYGQTEADRFSARPGTSEHQTGLAMDIGRIGNTCTLDSCFASTPEGAWLAVHAHEYGFIIRYPDGKEPITGYTYEPWHLRYVGAQLASNLFTTQLTLEEYFGL